MRCATSLRSTPRCGCWARRYAQPFGIAPTSLQRAAAPEGERAMARAATVAGVPHVVSSNAGFPLAEVGAIGAVVAPGVPDC